MTVTPSPGPSSTPGALPPGRTRGELIDEVAAALARVPRGANVVVAISGGPDSTACAFLVHEARPDLHMIAGHVRHGLRDDRHDVAAVRTHASWLGVRLELVDVVVESRGRGVESEARSQRYAALRRIARSHNAGWLLVGHTADDQAETLLLRLARGTGVPGLAGMAAVRGDVVRPLLRLRRPDVHRFVEMEGLPYARDPTNDDRGFARNRVRHELMPILDGLGPDVVGALTRLAELARDDAGALDQMATVTARTRVRHVGPVAAIPRRDLIDGHPAVTRRVLRALVLEIRGGSDPPAAAEVEAVRCLRSGALDLKGVVVTCAGGWTALGPAVTPSTHPQPLAVPGATPWTPLAWRLDATTPDDGDDQGQLRLGLAQGWRAPRSRVDQRVVAPGATAPLISVTLGDLPDPLVLTARGRQPGDRIVTAAGTRKLQDVFVDAGVPRQLRDLLPVIVADDRLVWVPGIAVDAAAVHAGGQLPQVHLVVAQQVTRRSGDP